MINNFSGRKNKLRSGEITTLDLPESNHIAKVKELKNIDEWVKQIWYWRTHLDVFIEDYIGNEDAPIKFEEFQSCIVRAMGNCSIVQDSESRGLGKTWKVGTVLPALAILYPGTPILAISKNVTQALQVINYIEKIADKSINLKREIRYPVKRASDYAEIRFHNDSVIRVRAMGLNGDSLRGERAKIIYVDEAVLIDTVVFEKVLRPILNFKREVWWRLKDNYPDYKDYPSKLIETSSAYLKSCDYYQRGVDIAKNIINGDVNAFLCCINYKTGERLDIIDHNKIVVDKSSMSKDVFDMEYGCTFIGAEKGSFYPYDLVSPCRVLNNVELYQPKGSTSRYVAALDIATSNMSRSDKTAIAVVKFTEKPNGSFAKQLVYLKTYKGYSLKMVADETRGIMIRFPNTEKLIIDVNGLGRGITSILQDSYVDPETNKEYPPLIPDTTMSANIGKGTPIIREYIGNNDSNNRGAIALKMFFENKSLSLPVPSMSLRGVERKGKKDVLLEEMAVFSEVDALTVELGNIKQIALASGIKFDTTNHNKHKDRYSALMMCCLYLHDMEENNKKNKRVDDAEGNFLGFCCSW